MVRSQMSQVMKRSQMSFNIFNLGEFRSFLEFRMAFSNGIVQPQAPHSDQSRFFTSSKLLTSRFSTICALRMVWPISTFRHGDWTNQFFHPTDPTLENPELTNKLTIQQRVFNHQNCGFQHQTGEVHHGDWNQLPFSWNDVTVMASQASESRQSDPSRLQELNRQSVHVNTGAAAVIVCNVM